MRSRKNLRPACRMSVLILGFVGLCSPDARASTFTPHDAAWKEAIILSGVAERDVVRPGVVRVESPGGRAQTPAVRYLPRGNQIRVYSGGAQVPYYTLVEEFLRSIYQQTLRASISIDGAVPDEAREVWVRAQMGWRLRSRAYGEPVAEYSLE